MNDPADPIRQLFAELARQPDTRLDLEEGAILIAAEEYPDLDVESVREELDALGAAARERARAAQGASERVEALNEFLFREEGFAGASEYFDPRNSYLNEVLERRRGIPITLALVYIGVGQRAGVDARGISFPGHFLVRCAGPQDTLVDAYQGRTISLEECEVRLGNALGVGAIFDPAEHLRDATPRETLVRVLSNLQRIFAEQGDYDRLLACCDRILLLTPSSPHALRERAMVYERLGWLAPAIADLDQAAAVLPDGELASQLRARRDALRAQRQLH